MKTKRPRTGVLAELVNQVLRGYPAGASGQANAGELRLKSDWVFRLLGERTLSDRSSVLRAAVVEPGPLRPACLQGF